MADPKRAVVMKFLVILLSLNLILMVSDTAGHCVIKSPQDCNFLKKINAKLDVLIAGKNSKGELEKILNDNSIFCAQA